MAFQNLGNLGINGFVSSGGGAPIYNSLGGSPDVMNGTQVNELATNADVMRFRVHRQAINQSIFPELFYLRDGSWNLIPAQPNTSQAEHITVTWLKKQPFKMDFVIRDANGLLTPENLNSMYNYNGAGNWDALIDEARKVRLRVGVLCYKNLVAGTTPTITGGTPVAISGSPTLITTSSLTLNCVNTTYTTLSNISTVAVPSGNYASGTVEMTCNISTATSGTQIQDGRQIGTAPQVNWESPRANVYGPSNTVTSSLSSQEIAAINAGAGTTINYTYYSTSVILTENTIQLHFTLYAYVSGAGNVAALTDESLQPGSNFDPRAVYITTLNNSSATFQFDLGSIQRVRNSVVRFVQQTGYANSILPSSVQLQVSPDNVSWVDFPAQPVDDDNTNHIPGDWGNSLDGTAVEISTCDIEQNARYVRLVVFASGNGNVCIDEIAIYGSNVVPVSTDGAILGYNFFTGYLGEKIDIDNQGRMSCTAIDVFKKCTDNNETRLTAQYILEDAADILTTLLTDTTYWAGGAEYETGWTTAEIGWYGYETLLTYPKYQGQSNNIYGYLAEIVGALGFYLYADGNGNPQLWEPPFRQYQPTRVMIADINGNNDVRHCTRLRSGKDMRNKVEISSGAISQNAGQTGAVVLFDPASVEQYGPRRCIITDPIMSSDAIRTQAANSFLRDYAWRLQTLQCAINPDCDTNLYQAHAFRAPARPSLYAKASTLTGNKRRGEMWMLDSIVHHITPSAWWGLAQYNPYFPFAVGSPEVTQLSPGTGGTGDPVLSMRLYWNEITDPHVSLMNIYVSSVGPNGPFNLVETFTPTHWSTVSTVNSNLINEVNLSGSPFILGDQYWVYATFVSDTGVESLPSITLAGTIGSAPAYSSNWTVTDFAIGLVQRTNTPDANGYYSYHFSCSWTSPPAGFKRMAIYLAPLAEPSTVQDPTALLKQTWPLFNSAWSWAGNYIPPGLTWDRSTAGDLTFDIYFRSTINFTAGQKMYARIFTSSATTRWRQWGGDDDFNGWPGNVAFCTF